MIDVEQVRAADGTLLAVRRLAGTGPLLVALHGFTGDGSTMLPLVEECRGERPCLLIDIIGHGQSAAPEITEPYTMASVVDQVLSLIGPHEPGTVHLLGYSMGGRIVLSMAARAPWYFGSITTISASPGLADPVERAKRHDADLERADEIEQDGLSSFVDDWLELDLFAPYVASLSANELEATTAQRKANSAVGLANSLRGTGTGAMPPVWTALQAIRSPLLAIAGSLDERYVEIARQMAEAAPFGEFEIIDGVGHVAHVENCGAVGTTVRNFLEV